MIPKSTLPSHKLHTLQHALGLDEFGLGRSYRNYYVCGPGHEGYEACRELVEAGLMVEKTGTQSWCGGASCFIVTEQGRAIVQSDSPPAPKTTRSQRRYRRFLAADTGMSFREWLNTEGASL